MRIKALALAAVGFVATALAIDLIGGQILISPVQRAIGPPPSDLGAESVKFESTVGPVAGWLIRADQSKGSVLLLHGVRSNRLQMVPRARWLKQLGYSVLMIDLPAHGETLGDHITFGFNEAKAVSGSLAFLHQQFPDHPIGVIGVSLGAASIVLSNETPNAAVLESMYPTLSDAIKDRMSIYLGKLGPYLAPLLLWQAPVRLQIPKDALRPIDHLRDRGFPVLIASGVRDLHTKIEEARSIYLATSEPHELWEVEGAGHVDLFDYDAEAYKAHVAPFLTKYMH